MAEEIKVKVDLEATAKDIETLKGKNAFNQQQLATVEGLLKKAQGYGDPTKLTGRSLTDFNNTIRQLSEKISKAATRVVNLSKEYTDQMNKVAAAQGKQSEAQEALATAQKKQADAIKKYNVKNYTFKNKKTGATIKSAKTVTDAFSNNNLEIFNKSGARVLAKYDSVVKSTGIADLATANQEVKQAEIKVDEATLAVKKEQDILSATNPGGGLSPETKEILTRAQDSVNASAQIKADVLQAQSAKNKEEEESKDLPDVKKAQSSSLGKAFKQFSLYAVALRTIQKAAREASRTISDLDKALTDQAMVTGMTRKQTKALLSDYQNLAAQLGTTTKEVAGVATEFIRQGKSISEALTLTEAAVSAAKVAGISGSESVNYLTTALNGFQLAASDALKVSDKFAAIAATSATSYEELATALSKVASQANLAGMSIDYTTALLAKGIETTREAPETIGTALKTIIARMRELTDYGATLEGDTDVNNVETQLAYVGIALKDVNGELRSTQDVLDELGKKWDMLNSNQQAAIAKALAGTRQQSRLIAMMSDYERVTELQQVAERSQGATAAQMETYMGGMEAAMNKLSNAWEQVTTTITNSDLIIGIINTLTNAMNLMSDILGNTSGMVALIGTMVIMGATVVGQKVHEYEMRKLSLQAELKTYETKLKERKVEVDTNLLAQQALITTLQDAKAQKGKLKDILEAAKIKAQEENNTALVAKYEAQIEASKSDQYDLDNAIAAAQAQKVQMEHESAALGTEISLTQSQIAQQQAGMGGLIASMTAGLSKFFIIMQAIRGVQAANVALKKAENAETTKGITLKKTEGTVEKQGLKTKVAAMFASISGTGKTLPTAIAAIALATTAVAAISGLVGGLASFSIKKSQTSAVDNITEKGNEIYRANEKTTAINSIASSYDKLDGKLIKTISDQKEMNSLLDQAADKLSDEEKEYYNSLQTDKLKREYLDQVQQQTRDSLKATSDAQRAAIKNSRYREQWLTGTDANALKVQDQVFAGAKRSAYEYLDSLVAVNDAYKDLYDSVEDVTNALIENMNAKDAFDLWNDKDKLNDLIDKITKVTSGIEGMSAAQVINSEDESLVDRTRAYHDISEALKGDEAALKAFQQAYQQYKIFDEMTQKQLEFIETSGLSIAKLNDFYDGYRKLQRAGVNITKEQFQGQFNSIIDQLTSGSTITEIIDNTFGSYLAAMDKSSEKYAKAYNALVNVMDSLLGESLMNIGQNLTKFDSTVSNFYKKSTEWSLMSESDRAQFLSDNAEIFSGPEGDKILKAFESGDFARIQQAMQENTRLQEELRKNLQDIETRIAIEEAKIGDERNEAQIKYLKQLKARLEDGSAMFQASLEVRLDQEKQQLEIYKDYLEKQRDALKESLEDRKEAYQDYFDTINKEEEAEDYEQEAQTYISNLAKISSSSDAASKSQAKELQQKLQDLEEERLKTLRQEAQEQVVSNIEDQVSSIDDKFDNLLDTDSKILAALNGDTNASGQDFLTSMLATNLIGKTALEAEDYIKNSFASAFGSKLDVDQVSVSQTSGGDLILNVAGQTINLSQNDSNTLAREIYDALARLGISR